VINGRSRENGERALARLAAVSGKASLALGDCSDHASAVDVARQAAAINGGIDIVVSAGAEGRVSPRPFADMTGDELVEAYQSRFFPRIFPVHAALPHMRERGGSIVMLCTDAARHPTPGESVVGAVGAGIILMTKALAKELARSRIRVNSVAMTLTSGTPSWDRIFSNDKTFSSKLFTKLNEKFPAGRPPSADEVADAVVFLASDHAGQITGQTLSVNGGLSFGGW
jgi:3-oxoacyl-[acyl-carrier protein] reductase